MIRTTHQENPPDKTTTSSWSLARLTSTHSLWAPPAHRPSTGLTRPPPPPTSNVLHPFCSHFSLRPPRARRRRWPARAPVVSALRWALAACLQRASRSCPGEVRGGIARFFGCGYCPKNRRRQHTGHAGAFNQHESTETAEKLYLLETVQTHSRNPPKGHTETRTCVFTETN